MSVYGEWGLACDQSQAVLCCHPLPPAAPPRLQGRKQGCSRGAPLSRCSPAAVEVFAKPAGPAAMYKGRVHHRGRKLPGGGRGTRGLGGWKGRPSPRAAFSRNKKPKEAPNNPVWWGSRRAGTPHWMQGGFPWLGCKIPCSACCPRLFLCLLAASAVMLGAGGGLPHTPTHATPGVLREPLYLLSLWEYLFLLIGTRIFHLGHGNKGGQVRSGAS